MATHVELEPLVSTDWLEAEPERTQCPRVGYSGVGLDAHHRAGRRRGDVSRHGGIPHGAYSRSRSSLTGRRTSSISTTPCPRNSPRRRDLRRPCRRRGVNQNTRVIAVDHMGGQFATRLWWALKAYGHDAVAVLDGGWNRWVDEGRPVESDSVGAFARGFSGDASARLAQAAAEEVLKKVDTADVQIVDAHDPAQYHGTKRRGPARRAYSGSVASASRTLL